MRWPCVAGPCCLPLSWPSCVHYTPHQPPSQQEEEETYYDAMKREMADRAAKTKAAMDALDPATRVAMEASRRRCCFCRCCSCARGAVGGRDSCSVAALASAVASKQPQ